MRVLVVTSKFGVGGKEQYILEYIRYLDRYDFEFVLVAQEVKCLPEHRNLFAEVFEMHDSSNLNIVVSEVGWGVDCVWAQGDAIRTASALSNKLNSALVVTIHNSIDWDKSALDASDHLVIDSLVSDGVPLICVSKEIHSQILSRWPEANVEVVANPISIDGSIFNSAGFGSLNNWILLSRSNKTEHIRAGLMLFMTYWRSRFTSRLRVITDFSSSGHSGELRVISSFRVAVGILGKRWVLSQPSVVLGLLTGRIVFQSHSSENDKALCDADVVLGMGRVVLEGIAQNKVAVLIGYDGVRGLVNRKSFITYEINNLSGRDTKVKNVKDVACDLLELKSRPSYSVYKSGLLDSYDVRKSALRVVRVFREARNRDRGD